MIFTSIAPWTETLSQQQYLITVYFLGIAALAMLAGFLRTWITLGEVGPRYRTAAIARVGILGIAFISYLYMLAQMSLGYDVAASDGSAVYVPNSDAINVMLGRYVEWSISVPLLTVELLAVCTLIGEIARRTRIVAVVTAAAMIFAGFLGAIVFNDGVDAAPIVLWGLVSCVFWILTNVVLIGAVRRSIRDLTPEASHLLRRATIFLLVGWAVYPVAYAIPIFFDGGAWATTMQVILTLADVIVKLGFAGLIHRVAKLRTAEDVRAGVDIHHESIWISSEKQSDAGQSSEVFLAEGAAVHGRRSQAATSAAVAAAQGQYLPIDDHE